MMRMSVVTDEERSSRTPASTMALLLSYAFHHDNREMTVVEVNANGTRSPVQPVLVDVLHNSDRNEVPDRPTLFDPLSTVARRDRHRRDLHQAHRLRRQMSVREGIARPSDTDEVCE